MHKEVLIDLTTLKNTNSGLCSVAKTFAEGFSPLQEQDIAFNFLVPPGYEGKYGESVKYTAIDKWKRHIPRLLPKVDLWHSTYQAYRFRRVSRGGKSILTIHDLNFLYEKSSLKARRYIYLMQRRINRASAVVAISQFVADDIKRTLSLGNKPLRVIYNCVAQLEGRPEQQPAFVQSPQRPFFFTLGQIREKKNFHVLLDVMKHFPEMDLYISGGEHKDEYGQFISERITQEKITNVFLTGTISEAEKCWMYRHATAFLFPSKFEGFGLPVLEAMQYGKPVFTSSMTSLPEVAGGHGFIWPTFDTEAMVAIIRKGLAAFAIEPERAARARNYANGFTLERHTQAYLALYRELLAS